MYKEHFEKFLDCSSPYYDKMMSIIEANINTPKVVVKNRNLHHIVPRFYFKYFDLPLDNTCFNLISLTIGDHFLVHYYMDLCAKPGWHKYTSPPWRMIIRQHQSEIGFWLSQDISHVNIIAEMLSSKKDEVVKVRAKKKESKSKKKK